MVIQEKIFMIIFFDNHGKEIIKLDYFNNNILYRARKFNSNPTEKRSVNNEPAKQNTLNTIVNNEQPKAKEGWDECFLERLQARQNQNNSVIHNSGSTQEDLEKTLARITNNQRDLNYEINAINLTLQGKGGVGKSYITSIFSIYQRL